MHQQSTSIQQTAAPIAPIDPTPIVQSDSPTAVILAIAILISILIGSITGLVRVIILVILHETKSGRQGTQLIDGNWLLASGKINIASPKE